MIPHFNIASRGLFRSKAHKHLFLKRLAVIDSLRNDAEAEHLKPIPPTMKDVAREMVLGMSAEGEPLPYWVNN